MSNTSPHDRLIVALDVDTEKEAIDLVRELGDSITFYKVGWQLFVASGVNVISHLEAMGKKIFLDLKLDDTPRTVEETVRNMATDHVEFFTLQGNGATAKAAKAGRDGKQSPKFLQVTMLSSWDQSDLREMMQKDSGELDLDEVVIQRTKKILASGCEGVIASGTSVKKLRDTFGEALLIVTPGIRPKGTLADDHKRTLTPYEAIIDGADYLVVGRPIRTADDKVAMAQGIHSEIHRGLEDKIAAGRTSRVHEANLSYASSH